MKCIFFIKEASSLTLSNDQWKTKDTQAISNADDLFISSQLYFGSQKGERKASQIHPM